MISAAEADARSSEIARQIREEKTRTEQEWLKDLPYTLKQIEAKIQEESSKGMYWAGYTFGDTPRKKFLLKEAVKTLSAHGYDVVWPAPFPSKWDVIVRWRYGASPDPVEDETPFFSNKRLWCFLAHWGCSERVNIGVLNYPHHEGTGVRCKRCGVFWTV